MAYEDMKVNAIKSKKNWGKLKKNAGATRQIAPAKIYSLKSSDCKKITSLLQSWQQVSLQPPFLQQALQPL